MKIIVKKNNGMTHYALEDNESVVLYQDRIEIGSPLKMTVADLNIETAKLYENVTLPTDWFPERYFFDGSQWSANPAWTTDYLGAYKDFITSDETAKL